MRARAPTRLCHKVLQLTEQEKAESEMYIRENNTVKWQISVVSVRKGCCGQGKGSMCRARCITNG